MYIIARMPGDCYRSSFAWMPVLPMTSFRSIQLPAVPFDQLYDFSDLHSDLVDTCILINFLQCFAGNVSGFLRSGLEDRIEFCVIEILYSLLEWPKKFDDGFGQFGFEMAVAFAFEMSFAFGGGFSGQELKDREQILDRGT